jgi:hypothetical protein
MAIFVSSLKKCYGIGDKGKNLFLSFKEYFVYSLFVNIFVLRKENTNFKLGRKQKLFKFKISTSSR